MNEELLKFLHGKLYKDKVDYKQFKNDMSTNLDVVNYVYDKMGYGTKGILKSKFYSDLGLQPNRQKGSLNDYMFELESKSLGGYKAYNGRGGGQGAVGGYQHRYDKHKDEIARVTGVKTRDDFYNNPFAQEQYQNHLVETQYKPHLPVLKQIAKNKGLKYNDTELMYIEHHEGYEGAKQFLLSGVSQFGSEKAIANRLNEGKRYWKSLGYDDSSFQGGSPVQQKILTLDQKVQKIYDQEVKNTKGLNFGVNKNNIRKKVYDEAFANGELNPNDFTEAEFSQLYQEKDYVNKTKQLAEKSKKRLNNQLRDQGLFESIGDAFAKYSPVLAPEGTLDTKNGKINIGLKEPVNVFNKNSVASQFDIYFTPEQIMKLQNHPLDKSGDPNSRLNTHLRNIQRVIQEHEQLAKNAESNGLNHKLKATVDYNNNIKAKLKGKGLGKDLAKFEKLASIKNLDDNQKIELQSLQEKLSQAPEFNEYIKNNQSLGEMKSQFDKLDDKYTKAKAFQLLEDSRHIANDNYKRSLSKGAALIKGFENIVVNTAKKLVQSPFDTGKFLGTIGEGVTGLDLGITDKNIIDAETEIHEIKTSKEQDGVITNKTRFTKNGKVYYGKIDDKGNVEEIYDDEGYVVQFPDDNIKEKYKKLAKNEYDKYGSEKDFNWTALGSAVKDTTPDLINLLLAGGIAKNTLGALSSSTRFGRLANLANNPRVLEAAGIVPIFSGQTMKSNIRDGKLVTPGEIAISTSKDLALEVLSEMIFAGPSGKLLADKGLDAAKFSSLTKAKTKDLIDNLATGKLSKLQFTKEIGKSLVELIKDAGGEGFEELAVDLLKPVTDGFLNDYLGTSFNPEIGTLEELGSTYLVGAAAGALMGGVNFGINVSDTKNKVQDYYKSLLNGAIANVNNGKTAVATVENPLLFKKFTDNLIEEGEVSQELGDTLSGIVQAAHDKSKHLFNEPINNEFSPSDDIKALYSVSAFNAEYFAKVADRKQELTDTNKALNDKEVEDYANLAKFNEKILNELNINIANKLNSPTTPTHILNKIGVQLTEQELVSLSEKHNQLAEKISNGKGTDIQKSKLLSLGLTKAVKDIIIDRKKQDPDNKDAENINIPDTEEDTKKIKEDIKQEEKKPTVDDIVEDPTIVDDNDAIKKELLTNLQAELDIAQTDDDYDIIRSEPLYKSDIFQKIINEHQLNKKLDNGEEEAKLKSEEEKQKIANELINQQGTEEQDNIPPAPNGSIEDFDNIPDKTDLNDLGFDQNEIDQLRKDSLELKKEIDLSIPPLPTLEDFDNIPNNEEAREILRAEKEKREAAKKEREEKNKKRLEEIDEKNSNKIAPTITQDVISEKDTNFMGVTPGYIDRNGQYTIQGVYEDGTTAIIKVKREIVEKGGEQSISNTEYIINQFPKKSSRLLYYHVIPNADVANLKNPLAHKVLSKITPDTTVYYEIDMDGDYNSKNPPIDKLEIDIVVYINDNDNIVPPTVEGARKIHIAKVPAFKVNDNSPSNQMVKQIRDVATTVLGNNKTGLIQLGTGVVAKTHSIPNVEYGKNLDNTTKRRELIQNELESPELYVVEVPYGDKVETIQESNGRVRVKNAILRNADNSSFVTFPVPESWLGALIKKVGNKWVKFDTKTIGEVKELDEKLYSLLRTIEDSAINGKEFNPYNDYKKTWLSLIGLNKDDRSGALLRYRSNVSTIDAENEKDDIINPRGGIAPLIIYHKGKGFTIDDGLYRKEYMSANQAFEILRNKRIHISGLKLSKDNFNDDEFALYRKKITPYLHTNHKLPGDGYYITHTVLLKPELTINENLNVNSQPIQISPEPTKTVKRRFKVSNNNYSAINNPTINDNVTWFRERFKEIGISVDDNTINQIAKLHNLGGKKVWGAFANAAVVLASDASNQVAKHEAFHVIFNLFLNDDQRIQILDEAFEKFGKELGITKEAYEEAKKQNKAKDILFKVEELDPLLDPIEREKFGLEPLRPTYRGTTLEEWEIVKSGGKFSSKSGFGNNPSNTTWVSDKKEYSEEYVKTANNGVLIEFKPQAIDKSTVESGQPSDTTGVRLGRGLELSDVQRVTDKNGKIIYEAPKSTISNSVNYTLKAVDILQSNEGKKIFDKGIKNNWSLDKILTELQIPKDQKQLILDSNLIDREEIITDLLANYSYTVEINTSKTSRKLEDTPTVTTVYRDFEFEGEQFTKNDELDFDGEYKEIYRRGGKQIKRTEFIEFAKKAEQVRYATPTQYYSNLAVPGGTNYIENEIATPAITPSIKGHAQFSTNKGIGWFRSDDKVKDGTQPTLSKEEALQRSLNDDNFLPFDTDNTGGIPTKTRRILEVQSDLFQKGRDKEDLFTKGGIYYINKKLDYSTNSEYFQVKRQENHDEIIAVFNTQKEAQDFIQEQKNINKTNKENKFLQLLNKDNNWVTFFVKSIIQDSAKKGYEKVLFPSGNTASKVEGHATLEEFKKQKEDRIKELEETKIKNTLRPVPLEINFNEPQQNLSVDEEINQLKQELERVEKEGFGALRPIYNFYENTVTNILNKIYGKENVKQITDEYGNTWNEVTIDPIRDDSAIRLKTEQDSYYQSQGPLIQLEEKLAELFEEYKWEPQLFSARNKDKFPKITKFLEDLYTFLYNNYQILKSYFTDSVTIDSLFHQLDQNILGRNFIGNRKKGITQLINRNISNLDNQVNFKISNWSSENTERYASFINKDLFDVYLRDLYAKENPDKLPITPTISEMVTNKRPLGLIIKDYFDNIDRIMQLHFNELIEDGKTHDKAILNDILTQFKTNINFRKLVMYSLYKNRGIKITLDDEDFSADEETGEIELFENDLDGWMRNVAKTNPVDSLSGKVKEFLSRINKTIAGEIMYDTDTGQTQYYSLNETHQKLLSVLSDSSDIPTFIDNFNELIDDYEWAKEMIIQIYGPDEFEKRDNPIDNLHLRKEDFIYDNDGKLPIDNFLRGDIIRSIYSTIGDLRNVDLRFLKKKKNGDYFFEIANRNNVILKRINSAKNYFKNNYFYDNNSKLQESFDDLQIENALAKNTVEGLELALNKIGFFPTKNALNSIIANTKDFNNLKKIIKGFVLNLKDETLKSKPNLTIVFDRAIAGASIKYKDHNGKNVNTNIPFKAISGLIFKHDMTEQSRMVFTVKGEKRYNHILNNQLSREIALLNKDPEQWVNNQTKHDGNDIIFHSKLDWYKQKLSGNLRLTYLLGVVEEGRSGGIEYGDMFISDIQAMNFNAWLASDDQNKNDYAVPVFSDATNKAFLQDTTYDIHDKNAYDLFLDRYASIAFAELDRIHYLRTNKEIDPTFKSEFDYLEKNGYDFYLLPYLNKLPYDLNNPSIREKMFVNIDGVLQLNPDVKKEITKLINEHLENEFIKYKNDLVKNKLIVENTKLNRYDAVKNGKLAGGNDIEKGLKTYFFNQSYYNNIYLTVFSGDVSHYKNMVDQQKRNKQVDAPNQRGFWEKSHNRVLLLKDIEVPTPNAQKIVDDLDLPDIVKTEVLKALSSNNITDAGTIHTLARRKEIMKAYQWYDPKIHDVIFDKLQNGKQLDKTELDQVMGPLKPFYYGLMPIKDQLGIASHLVPVQGKNSEILLLPSLAYLTKNGKVIRPTKGKLNLDNYQYPDLAKLLHIMEEKEIGTAMFESAFKASAFKFNNFEDIDDNIDKFDLNNTVDLPNEYWGIQQTVPEKSEEVAIRIASQIRKIITGDMDPNLTFDTSNISAKDLQSAFENLNDLEKEFFKNMFDSAVKGKIDNNQIKDLFELIMHLDISEEIKKTSEKNSNPENVINYLLGKELQDSPSIETIEAFTKQNDGYTLVPLEIQAKKNEKLLNSQYKAISKIKRLGAALVNASSFGFINRNNPVEDQLQIKYKYDNEGKIIGIDYIEAAIPANYAFLRDYQDEHGNIDINNIPEELRYGIFYRIPTEGKYSVFPIKITKILPKSSGGQIILPREVTTIAGLDFDVDKLYGYFKYPNTETKGSFEAVKDRLIEYGLNLRDDEIEALIDNILSNNTEVLLNSGIENITQITEIVVSGYNKKLNKEIKAYPSGLSNKKARANLMIDLMFNITQSQEFAKDFFNIGSKQQLVDELRELRNLGRVANNEKIESIAYHNTQQSVSASNIVGKRLIGIFANSNAFHNLIQKKSINLEGPPIDFYDNGTYYSKIDPEKDSVGQKVSKNLSILLFASTEDTKDPVLAPLNINMFTAGLATTLIRYGIPLKDTLKYLNTDLLLEVTAITSNESLDSLSDGLAKYLNSNPDLKETVARYKLDLDNNTNSLTDDQNKVAREIVKLETFLRVGTDLLLLDQATKSDTGNVGPSLADVNEQLEKIASVHKKIANGKFLISGASDVLPTLSKELTTNTYKIKKLSKIAQINSFVSILVSELNDLNKIFYHLNTRFDVVRKQIGEYTRGGRLTAKQINYINNEVFSALLQKGLDKFGINYHELMVDFPQEFMESTVLDDPRYEVLRSLFVIEENAQLLPVLETATSLSFTEQSTIKALLEEMLLDTYSNNSTNLAVKLIIYSLVTSLNFKKQSFLGVIPSTFFKTEIGQFVRGIMNGTNNPLNNYSLAELNRLGDIIYKSNFTQFTVHINDGDYATKNNLETIHVNNGNLTNGIPEDYIYIRIPMDEKDFINNQNDDDPLKDFKNTKKVTKPVLYKLKKDYPRNKTLYERVDTPFTTYHIKDYTEKVINVDGKDVHASILFEEAIRKNLEKRANKKTLYQQSFESLTEENDPTLKNIPKVNKSQEKALYLPEQSFNKNDENIPVPEAFKTLDINNIPEPPIRENLDDICKQAGGTKPDIDPNDGIPTGLTL